jgi:hypothetical protein
MGDVANSGATSTELPAGATEEAPASEVVVPDELKRFADADGKIDITKVGSSYSELEKELYSNTQKLSALERSYNTIAEKAVQREEATPEDEYAEFARDPKGYTQKAVDSSVGETAVAIQSAILEMEHPELKDVAFKKGLQEYAKTLPPSVRGNLSNFDTARWAIKEFKDKLKEATTATSTTGGGNSEVPHTESPSASTPSSKGGKTYTRTEIKDLMRNDPKAYAEQSDDITAAYREGRVK